MKPRARLAPRRGFTFIELVVVIAIIDMLTATLFPVFAQARNKARGAFCLSNMRQMNVALMQYVQDYDETFPFLNVRWTPSGGATRAETGFDQPITPYIKNAGVFKCPSDAAARSAPDLGRCNDGELARRMLQRSYCLVGSIDTLQGYQAGSTGADPNTGVVDPNRAVTMAELTASSDTLVFTELREGWLGCFDANAWRNCDGVKLLERPFGQGGFGGRCNFAGTQGQFPGHAKRGNYGFADGHVKNMKWTDAAARDWYLFKRAKP